MAVLTVAAPATTRPGGARAGRVVPYLPVAALVPLWWALARAPFWRDEVATTVAAGKTPSALWSMVNHSIDAPMGLYYFLLGPLVRATSDPALIRLPSLAATAVAVAVTVSTARRIAGGWSGFLAGLLMVANAVLLYWAGIARAYPLALVATTLATHLLLTAKAPRTRTVLAFGLCAATGIYLHAMSALLFAAMGVALLLFPRFRVFRWPFLAALTGAAVWSVPLAIKMREQAGATSWIPLVTTWRYVFEMGQGLVGGAALLLTVGVGVLLTLIMSIRIGASLVGALLLMVLLPFAVLAAAGTVDHVFMDRYLIFLVPPLALLASLGWGHVPRMAVVPAVLCVGALAVYAVAARVVEPPVDNPQAAAAFIATHDAPGDVIVYSPTTTRTEVRYYLLRRRDVQAVDVAVPPGTVDARSPNLYLPELPAARVRAALASARRIWWVGFPGSKYRPLGANTAADVYASLPPRPIAASRWFGDLNVALVQERP